MSTTLIMTFVWPMDFILQYSVFCAHVIMCGVYVVVWDTTQFLECIMRMVHSRKNESNFDLGDESRQFARTNLREPVQTDGRLYFLTRMISNNPILEQPKDRVMPKCSTMRLVLEFSVSHDIRTKGSAFGTRSGNRGEFGAAMVQLQD